jgi:hypothetical protein
VPPSFAQPPVRQAQILTPQPQPLLVAPKKRGRPKKIVYENDEQPKRSQPKKIVGVSGAMAKSGPKKPDFEHLLNDENIFGSFEDLYINLRKYNIFFT